MSDKRRIAVALIYGGRGYESEVSLRGKEHVLPLLNEKNYKLLPIFIDKGGRWLYDGARVFPAERGFIREGSEIFTVDCAIPLLHGDFGEDGRVQGALECASIPYVGCDTSAAAVCRDKSFVKAIARGLGIPTLPHLTVLRCEGLDFALRRCEESLDYPLFIKPARLGSSVGTMAAYDKCELISALTEAFNISGKVIVEPCLTEKRELECGYFSAKGKELFTNPGEILIGGTYGYEEKYLKDEVRLSIRADVDRSVAEAVREYSRRLVRALGVRDLARIDFFLSGERLYFNEINTFPGFTDGSLYAKMIEAAGIPERELFSRLIEGAIARG